MVAVPLRTVSGRTRYAPAASVNAVPRVLPVY
jgi:hypothetical protein